MNPTERLRRRYKPARITLLFVGESAPAGGTFFYAKNSTLYREMRAAFVAAMPQMFAVGDFLETFRGPAATSTTCALSP